MAEKKSIKIQISESTQTDEIEILPPLQTIEMQVEQSLNEKKNVDEKCQSTLQGNILADDTRKRLLQTSLKSLVQNVLQKSPEQNDFQNDLKKSINKMFSNLAEQMNITFGIKKESISSAETNNSFTNQINNNSAAAAENNIKLDIKKLIYTFETNQSNDTKSLPKCIIEKEDKKTNKISSILKNFEELSRTNITTKNDDMHFLHQSKEIFSDAISMDTNTNDSESYESCDSTSMCDLYHSIASED